MQHGLTPLQKVARGQKRRDGLWTRREGRPDEPAVAIIAIIFTRANACGCHDLNDFNFNVSDAGAGAGTAEQ